MKSPSINLTAVLSFALAAGLFIWMSGLKPLEVPAGKAAERISERAQAGEAQSESEDKSGVKEEEEPEMAARPPRVGDVPRRLVDLPENASPSEKIAAFLSESRDLSDPAVHAEFVTTLSRLEDLQRAETAARAAQLGLPLLTQHGSQLTGFAGDFPLYEISHNAGAATSIGVDQVRQAAPNFPNGEGIRSGFGMSITG